MRDRTALADLPIVLIEQQLRQATEDVVDVLFGEEPLDGFVSIVPEIVDEVLERVSDAAVDGRRRRLGPAVGGRETREVILSLEIKLGLLDIRHQLTREHRSR